MQYLNHFNPQRQIQDFVFPEYSLPKRTEFFDIQTHLENNDFMISLSGLRRTGKTTLAKQILAEKLHSWIDPRYTLYYKFSDTDTDLHGVLDYYFKTLHTVADIYSNTYIIVLDEMQFVKDRQNTLINYYEVNKKIKWIVTWSASLYINRHYQESLAGRIVDITIEPLLFTQYLALSQHSYTQSAHHFTTQAYHQELSLYKQKFDTYIIWWEFPEYTLHPQIDMYTYFQDQIISKIFSKDIELFGFKKKEEIHKLYTLLCHHVSGQINTQNLWSDIWISHQTIKTYIQGLEQMHLVHRCDNHTRSMRKKLNTQPKIYASSVNMLCSQIGIKNRWHILHPDTAWWVIENYIYTFLKHHHNNVSFWRKWHSEIDFVVEHNWVIIPIEVKHSAKYTQKKLQPILNFCKKNELTEARWFYGGEWKEEIIDGIRIVYIPWRV